MATSHKRAHEVTLVPTEEKSAFQEFVDRTWKPAAFVAVIVTAAILVLQARRERISEARSADWDALAGEIQLGTLGSFGISLPGGREMTDLAATLEDSTSGPTAALLAVKAYLAEEDAEGARAALDRLSSTYADHALVTEEHSFVTGSPPLTTVAFLGRKIDELASLRADREALFENPPLPEGAPRVRITTNRGDLVVGLYVDRAPEHAANFLELCREDFYVGTKFHKVQPGTMIEGGDPNTRAGDPATWGQGGPDHKLDPELSEELHHFAGVLTALKTPVFEEQSNGSQFAITVRADHRLDGQRTIFGRLLEGADVVKAISESPPVENTQRPEEPVEITALEVLE